MSNFYMIDGRKTLDELMEELSNLHAFLFGQEQVRIMKDIREAYQDLKSELGITSNYLCIHPYIVKMGLEKLFHMNITGSTDESNKDWQLVGLTYNSVDDCIFACFKRYDEYFNSLRNIHAGIKKKICDMSLNQLCLIKYLLQAYRYMLKPDKYSEPEKIRIPEYFKKMEELYLDFLNYTKPGLLTILDLDYIEPGELYYNSQYKTPAGKILYQHVVPVCLHAVNMSDGKRDLRIPSTFAETGDAAEATRLLSIDDLFILLTRILHQYKDYENLPEAYPLYKVRNYVDDIANLIKGI